MQVHRAKAPAQNCGPPRPGSSDERTVGVEQADIVERLAGTGDGDV